MPNACDSLGTIWVPSDSFVVLPGATQRIELNPGQPILVIAYGASGYQPGTWWDASTVSLYAKKDGKTSFMMSDRSLPGNVLHDSTSGLRYLAEPIPLHTKQWLDLFVTNDGAVATPIKGYAEAIWMGDADLDRYESDPVFRLAIKQSIATLIRGR